MGSMALLGRTAGTATGRSRDVVHIRLRALFDAGTLRLLAARDDSGVLWARGEVEGTPAVAFATDGTRMGGAMGIEGCRNIVDAIDAAVRERVPVVGLWHSGGARLAEGVVATSEEHTSELQSRQYLVCRLLLEKNARWHGQLSDIQAR